MGCVEPVKIGRIVNSGASKGKHIEKNRVWTAPCHDWSKAEQQIYMNEFGLPVNRMKIAVGLSGECFCGAFASPGELDALRQHAPDVAAEIDRLAIVAKESGKPCVWGQRPISGEVAQTGPMCSSCDQRAAAAGFKIAS
jgi:hypothetical protein